MFDSRSHAARHGGAHWHDVLDRLAVAALCAGLIALVALSGCGDDKKDNGGSAQTNEQQMEESLAGLVGFGTNALATPEASVMQHQAISGLLSGLGIQLPTGGLGGLAFAAGDLGATRRAVQGMVPNPGAGFASAQVDTFYGTYVRDRNDTTEPFPGWVIETPDSPADGLVFQFPADQQDIVYVNPQNGQVTPVAGEIRFLDIVPDISNDPDAEITSMTFELALGIGGPPLTTTARITYAVTYSPAIPGSDPQLLSARIGDTSNVAGDSFIGTTAFAISFDANPGIPPLADPEILVILLDTSTDPDYAIGWSLEADDYNAVTEMPQAVSTTFAYGPTSDPMNPPWALNVDLTDFREDPTNPDDFDADVSGSVTVNGTAIATFAGDTTEVQVAADVNGDGLVDEEDTCINIDITIDEHTDNICVVFVEIASTLPQGGIGALFAGPYCPCAAD